MRVRDIYKESFLLKTINFITISSAISYRMTILPDLLFPSLMSSRFFICVFIALEVFTLFINQQNGLSIKWNVVKFPPLMILLVLVCLQIIITIAYMQIESTGAAIFTGLNDYLLAVLVYSLICARNTILPREYIIFAVFNIGITSIAFILTQLGLLSPYTNEINGLSSLFYGNVESGQTYYMPGYLAVQSSNIRVSLTSKSYLGWSFEPHVFCLFVIPAIFYLVATCRRGFRFIWILIGLFMILQAFSVTAFLSAFISVFLYLFVNFRKGSWNCKLI